MSGILVREKWSSGIGFILASIGSAVGIGNIWRFPYIVGDNGGGAFLIPYVIAVFMFGLPLMILEFSLGRHYKTSVVSAFSKLGKKFEVAGLFLVFMMVMILGYYLVVTSWVLAYSLFFLSGASVPFSQFTGSYYPILFFLASAGLVFLVVRAGVKGGIEKLSKVLIPLLVTMLLVLLVTSLSQAGAMEGLAFYLTPDFSKLSEPSVWTAAFGQAFFSLSVGTGVMLTYASYMREGNLVRDSVVIAVSDLLIAVLAGFVIFPLVFSFGLAPSSGVQLTFISLPLIFHEMEYGLILGAMFFSLLFFAALTSAVSFLEVPVATLIDHYRIERKKATAIVSIMVIIVGLPPALSYTTLKLGLFGTPFLDLYDLVFGTLGIITAGLVLTIVGGWFVKKEDILGQIVGGKMTKGLFMVIVKYFIPLVLIVNLATVIAKLIGWQ
ncbi:MAG: sodium-dependent transporter [Candidatus Methanoperedens sp.]|nr:sodium-dependent transporter [Candidatus Methanoperedens sp.]